eukprot:m.23403 g.23403  ORF g.23403 m.23403 type:complete len:1794 (-) comp4077_c0_seq1:138-5519(-)
MAGDPRCSGHQIETVSFGAFTEQDIRRLSVCRVTNPSAFDTLMHPTAGGLYDPAMGPLGPTETCPTCQLSGQQCPGHVGHIELPLRVFHPAHFKTMMTLVRGSCTTCHRLRAPRAAVHLLEAQLELLDNGFLLEAKDLEDSRDDAAAGMDDDEAGNPAAANQTDIRYRAYLRQRVADVLESGGSNDQAQALARRSTQVKQYRDQIIGAFLAHCGGKRRCHTCGGIDRRIVAQHSSNVIALALKPKDRQRMEQVVANWDADQTGDDTGGAGAADGEQEESAADDDDDDDDVDNMEEDSSEEEDDKTSVDNVGANDDDSDDSSVENAAPSNTTANSNNNASSADDSGSDDSEDDDDEDSDASGTTDTAAVAAAPLPTDAPSRGRFGRETITPEWVYQHLKAVWKVEGELLARLYQSVAVTDGVDPHEFLFLKVLPVAPNRFRPAAKLGEQVFENGRTVQLTAVVKGVADLVDKYTVYKQGGDGDDGGLKYIRSWQRLQQCVNEVVDARLNPLAGTDAAGGVKQVLEKKEGLFRKHMMGKRVNYACRSVISPDPMINENEVGIPEVFALKLTYPETVTERNFNTLHAAVLNGPNVHPGATHVMDEFGNLSVLSADRAKRVAIAKQLLAPPKTSGTQPQQHVSKQVYRHIRNGDYVLANRQPTLHKASIMAHRARVLPGERTLRLHYANCKSYNADFDGDEMNVHFPQNELGRAEAAELMHTQKQYISIGGGPLRGLIQDHIVSGTRMLCRDAFYTREVYQQMVYAAVGDRYGRIDTMQPAILRPQRLWTGKQIISSIMACLTKGRVGLNLVGKTQTSNAWVQPTTGPLEYPGVPSGSFEAGLLLEGENTVIFRNGQMLCGILDKKQIGSSAKGLVHAVQEIYGGDVAGELLSALGKLFTEMVKHSAHTFGIEDVLLTDEGEQVRTKLLNAARVCGPAEAARYTKLEDENDKETLTRNIEKIFRDEREMAGLDQVMMSATREHAASVVSATCPTALLKAFPHNHLQIMTQTGAKGSSVNATQISSLLGQQALEGKRVPVMVSGKTLPAFPPFDPSASAGGMIFGRFLTGLSPSEYYFHCMAGREGLVDTAVKTSRSGYLQRCLIKHMEDLQVHYDLTVRDADGSVLQFLYGEDGLDVTETAQLSNFEFMQDNYIAMLDKHNAAQLAEAFPDKYGTLARKKMKAVSKAREAKEPLPDPVLSSLRPDRYFGSVSEQFNSEIDAYLAKVPKTSSTLSRKKVQQLLMLKWFGSLADPGEPVGVLAAQAIGEPSTQMTLNTFHFAGRSDMNVTLGIPRLREILMTASVNIKTPIMTVPLRDDYDGAERLARRLRRVTLADMLQSVTVKESLTAAVNDCRERVYKVRLEFVGKEENESFQITRSAVLDGVEWWLANDFVRRLSRWASGKRGGGGARGRSAKRSGDGDSDNDDEDDDEEGDDTSAAASGRRKGRNDNAMEADDGNDDDDEGTGGSGGGGGGGNGRRKSRAAAGADSSDDEDVDMYDDVDEEAGTLASSALSKKKQGGVYGDGQGDGEEESSDDDSADHSGDEGDSDVGDGQAVTSHPSHHAVSHSKKERINAIVSANPEIVAYDYCNAGDWCEVTLRYDCSEKRLRLVPFFEEVAKTTELRAVRNINRAALIKSSVNVDKPDMMQVEGQNLGELWKYPHVLDLNRLASNDISAILRTYGVEAARATIVNQVNEVFGVYGIKVDHRHMSLVADSMTFLGDYRAMNRTGIKSKASPLLKMSFESTFDFLKSAALYGDSDALTSSSAQLVVGKPTHGGTGAFDLRSRLTHTDSDLAV